MWGKRPGNTLLILESDNFAKLLPQRINKIVTTPFPIPPVITPQLPPSHHTPAGDWMIYASRVLISAPKVNPHLHVAPYIYDRLSSFNAYN